MGLEAMTFCVGENIISDIDMTLNHKKDVTRTEIAKIVGMFTDTVIYPTEFNNIVGHWQKNILTL